MEESDNSVFGAVNLILFQMYLSTQPFCHEQDATQGQLN